MMKFPKNIQQAHPFFRQTMLLIGYLAMIMFLFGIGWKRIFNLQVTLSLLLGMTMLSAAQWRQLKTPIQKSETLQRNALISGGLLSMLSLLSNLNPAAGLPSVTGIAVSTTAMLYSGIIFLLLETLKFKDQNRAVTQQKADPFSPEVAYPILTEQGLTPREIHVALKLFENRSNKEIGEMLFISEATVKKHLQNLYRKTSVNDRQDFINTYLEWVKSYV